MATHEYTHAYRMWKSVTVDNSTWVWFKLNFQESYLDIEELEQTAGAAGYESTNSVKHGEMEDAFMNFESDIEARDAAFTKIMKTNGNLSTQLR